MLQFYLLSVVTLVFGGLSLLLGTTGTTKHTVQKLLTAPKIRIGLGAIAVIVGIFKFFVRAPFDEVAVVGDLLPALAGIVVGAVLIADIYAAKQRESEVTERIKRITRIYRIPFGVVGLVAGLAHFFVPGTVII
jgi:hypothetical protein